MSNIFGKNDNSPYETSIFRFFDSKPTSMKSQNVHIKIIYNFMSKNLSNKSLTKSVRNNLIVEFVFFENAEFLNFPRDFKNLLFEKTVVEEFTLP